MEVSAMFLEMFKLTLDGFVSFNTEGVTALGM